VSPEQALVRRWAQAVNARDRDALVAESDPEIYCYPLQVGLTGHYRGHEGIRRWLDDMDASALGHQVSYEGIRTLADGRVALFGTLRLDGNPISPYTLIATVAGDKVVQMRSYLSDEDTLRHLKMID
jgi:SnoaL-like domain